LSKFSGFRNVGRIEPTMPTRRMSAKITLVSSGNLNRFDLVFLLTRFDPHYFLPLETFPDPVKLNFSWAGKSRDSERFSQIF
jgi:hypothetical protein